MKCCWTIPNLLDGLELPCYASLEDDAEARPRRIGVALLAPPSPERLKHGLSIETVFEVSEWSSRIQWPAG